MPGRSSNRQETTHGGEAVHRIEITGEMDRHAVEALKLEVQQLAKRYGIDVRDFRIAQVAEDGSESQGGELPLSLRQPPLHIHSSQ